MIQKLRVRALQKRNADLEAKVHRLYEIATEQSRLNGKLMGFIDAQCKVNNHVSALMRERAARIGAEEAMADLKENGA